MNIKKGMWVAFKDIPEGVHFQDNTERRFIKLAFQTVIGLPVKYWYLVSYVSPQVQWRDTFNAIDYTGYASHYQDEEQFKIIGGIPDGTAIQSHMGD